MDCSICVRKCNLLAGGAAGYCGSIYRDEGGALKSAAYGRLTRVLRQPVANLPLNFWAERLECFAFATHGCNMRCRHCCNRELAHVRFDRTKSEGMQVYSPEALVAAAQRLGLALATDFNEAVGLYHYVLDVWRLAAENGVPCILTTNGLFTEETLVELLPNSAAVRVDIKGWSEQALRAQGFWFDGMDVESPLRNLVVAGRYPVHREMTYCLIPTVNDDPRNLEMLAKRLRSEAGDVPVTVSNHYIANTIDTFPVATRDDVYSAAAVFSSYLSKVGTFVRE